MNGDDRASPLPGDIRALIDADLRAPSMSEEAQNRVLRRMGAGFLAAGVATTIATATTGGAAAGAASSAGTGILYGLFARKATLVAAAFLLSGATGVGGYVVARQMGEARTRTSTTTTYVPTVAPSIATVAPELVAPATPKMETPAPANTETAAPPSVIAPPVTTTPTLPTASASAARDTDLASERALIEMARSALSHGNPAQALDAVGRHAAKFPYGQLVEERENIAIHALVASGRLDEAHARAERFHKRFPKSIFLPSIDAAVGTAP